MFPALLLEILAFVGGLLVTFFGWVLFRALLALWGALLGAAGAAALGALLGFGVPGIVVMTLVGGFLGAFLAYGFMVVGLVIQSFSLGLLCAWIWGGGVTPETRTLAGVMIGTGLALLAAVWHRTIFTFYLGIIGAFSAVSAGVSLASRSWPEIGDPAWGQLLVEIPRTPETLPEIWVIGVALGLALAGTYLQRETDESGARP